MTDLIILPDQDKNFLNPACQHEIVRAYITTLFGQTYSVVGCIGCLRLIQCVKITDPNIINLMI